MKHPDRLDIQLDGGFYILLAVTLLVIPLPWLLAWLSAAALHEAGHTAAIVCCGHTIVKIKVGWRGAKILTDHLGKHEWFCAAAGPMTGILLLLLIHVTPRLSVCGAMQSAINLLPIYPLDGGRVLKGLLQLAVGEAKAEKIAGYISDSMILLLGFALCGVHKPLGFLCVILAIMSAVWRVAKINIPCKRSRKWVQ